MELALKQPSNRNKPARVVSGRKSGATRPDWANGLKNLYDSVLHEPLPDSFSDLLKRLDDDNGK